MRYGRWVPEDFGNLQQQFNRVIDELYSNQQTGRLEKASWIPPVDAWETEEGFHLNFDIPGVDKESIDIQLDSDQLTIKGERKAPEDRKYLRNERVFGPFFRAFTLETPVDREKIKAVFKSGVLEIVLPKKEEQKPRQIQIEIGDEE